MTFDGNAETPGDARRMSVTWEAMASSLAIGSVLYLADGSVRLRVAAARPDLGELDAASRSAGRSPPARDSTSPDP